MHQIRHRKYTLLTSPTSSGGGFCAGRKNGEKGRFGQQPRCTGACFRVLGILLICLSFGGLVNVLWHVYPPCETTCGRVLWLPRYSQCVDGENVCSFWRSQERACGTCPESHQPVEVASRNSPFQELQWKEPSCPGSPYDWQGTLVFCQRDEDSFGYRLSHDTTCGLLAPLLRMQAGLAYQLHLINEANVATNLHLHGLHVAGSGNADDITRRVGPGQVLMYNYSLPVDHMDGTFWYHAHVDAHRQVGGGAAGMVLVERDYKDKPSWLDQERLLLVTTIHNEDYINGERDHVVSIPLHTWFRLRLAFADAEAEMRQLIFDHTKCQVHPVAHDGVWRNQVPSLEPRYEYLVTGASRLDVLIRCQENAQVWYRDRDSGTIFALVGEEQESQSTETDLVEVPPQWTPPRPAYLQDVLLDETMEDTFIMTVAGTTGINNRLYNENSPLLTVPLNQVQQWTMFRTNIHPMHLHIHHMQVVTPGGCGNQFEYGEWYDTISAETSDGCTVRFRMDTMGGKTVIHCHTLSHEDQGVMGWINVTGGSEPSRLHLDPFPVSELDECIWM